MADSSAKSATPSPARRGPTLRRKLAILALFGIVLLLVGEWAVGINLGHSGYRYWQEFPPAMRHLDEIRPAAIVVMFTGNDFEPQYDPFASTNIDG